MASDSRALTLKLLADVADYQRKLNQSEKTTEGFSGKIQEFGKKAGVAFAAAGAAAAAYAGKLLVEGVKAAIADEAAQEKLRQTLVNVTGATNKQIAATEDYISKTSLAFGVTDDDLRPSLQRLAVATGDVERAQRLQTLAINVAAGSGKSLEAVSNALARAYEGNTSSLSRLGIGLSAAELKTMSFDQVTMQLSNTFKNAASTQADTLQGKMTRLQIAFDEAKEAVGARLLPIITNLINFFIEKGIPAIQSIADRFRPFTKAISDNKEEMKAVYDFAVKFLVPLMVTPLRTAITGVTTALSLMVKGLSAAVNAIEFLFDKYRDFVNFLKNNPLSKFLGKLDLNPFNNASFQTTGGTGGVSDNVVSAGLVFGANQANVGGPVFDSSGNVVESPGLGRRDISGLSQQQQIAVRRSIDLQAETARLRDQIRSRRTNANNGGEGVGAINVSVGVVGDPESLARTIRDIVTDSFNRGTGGLTGAF